MLKSLNMTCLILVLIPDLGTEKQLTVLVLAVIDH